MDTRIRIIAEAITKDAENSLKRLADLEKDLIDETDKAGQATKKQETHLNSLNDTASKSNTMFANLGKTMIGLFAVDKILQYSMEVFNLTAKFEQYNTTLKNMFQSQDVATKAMTMIKNEAAKTNWSVDQLTDSFIKLKGRGINMTSKDIQGISDVANFLKKDFGQVVEAINDVNNTERWNEIGIKAKTSGDKVSLTFNGVTKTVSRTEAGILSAITGFGQLNGVMGLTADISDDLAGKKSNLGDKMDFLMVKIGKGLTPVFNFLLDLFLKGAEFVSDFIDKSAPLTFVYGKIADIFTTVFDIGKELFLTLFPSAKDKVFDLSTYIKYFSTVLYTVVVPFQLIKTAVVGVIDSFRVLSDASGMVWKALKGDFEGAKKDAKSLETSWNALKTNGTQNFGAISKGFNKIWSDGNEEIKKSSGTFDDWVSNQKSGNASVVKNNKESNDKKSNDNQKHLEFIEKLKKDSDDKIKKIDEDYTEFLFNEYQKRSKIIDNAVGKITENNTQRWGEYSKTTINLEEWKAGRIKQLNDKVGEDQKKRIDKTIEELKKSQEFFEAIFEQSFDSIHKHINDFYEYLDKKSKEGETAAERQGAALNKAFLEPMKENVNAAKALISGDYLGAAKGLVGYFEGIWKTTFGIKKTLNEIRLNEFNLQWESTMSNLESYSEAIKENFEGLADASIEFNTTQKTGVDALIDAEIKRAGEIRNAYDLALSKEDELYNKAKSNEESVYSTLKSNAESQFSKDIQDINDKYDLEISKIIEKYDLISVKNSQRFDAESLAISEGVNNDLMKFVSNEDLKVALTDKYELEKGKIKEKFALAYVPITEGMSDAEIKGINDAIKARDEAFAKLADWQTSQIQFVITNGKLEIDTFTDVQKVIAKGKDDQYQLGLGYQAQQIIDETNKNIEIEGAENTKNANIETATTAHKANLEVIETNHKTALQAIEINHNNEVVRLGQEKDAALLSSFNALKDAMKNGYAEILQSASDAYTKGLITAQEYLDKLKEIQALRSLVGDSAPSLTTEIRDRLRSLGIPGFKTGTEMVGGVKGVDKNLAWLSNDEAVLQGDLNKKRLDKGINRFQMVEYAINYKSILDGGFQPLQIKTSALDKLEEHKAMQYLMNLNMNGVIDKLDRVESALKSIPIQNFTLDENGLSKYVETKNNVTKFKAKRLK